MKKIIIILIFLVNYFYIFCFVENTTLIKRKILILPFINKNNIEEYDYLSNIIMETLLSELMETDKYQFTNFSLTDDKLNGKEYNKKDFIDLKVAKDIAKQLDADVVITGQYLIFERKIMVLIKTIDILTGELVALTKVEGSIGVELFDVINTASKDMTEQIINKLPMINQKEYDEKNIKNKKIVLTPMKKAGIGLFASGTSLMCIGLPILLYDIAGYSGILRANLNKYLDRKENYAEYEQSYNIFNGLLISSICVFSLGLVLDVIGLPLLIINIKNKKKQNISFIIGLNKSSFNLNNDLSFLIRIKI